MGLKNNDLKDTVANLVSVDEYESKTGAPYEVIVVAFHVIDELPGDDLSDFISKTYIPVIDSERSPNPNDEGYYLVFVEMKRDEKFFKDFDNLIKEVERLAGKVNWKISPYLDDNIYAYDNDLWKSYIIVDPLKYITKQEFMASKQEEIPAEENVQEYFQNSNAYRVITEGKTIKLCNQSSCVSVNIVGWYSEKELMNDEKFKNIPFILDESRIELSSLKKILGQQWDVLFHDGKAVISRKGSDKVLYAELA